MQAIYFVSVWLHILAATAWMGGMFFLVLAVVPWLRRGGQEHAGPFLRETGARYRVVGWACFGLLFVTGAFNLWVRGVRLGDLARAEWLMSPFGQAVVIKVTVFGVVLALSAYHDFVIGPRAATAIERGAGLAEAEGLRRRASLLGRLNAILAIVLVALAVILVRGWPW
ncbi:MAG: CopD family protein [Deltaproteobacteria bacterium]|nr:CopD family protein [Deltaproteobacteria bacterium]